MVFCASSSRTNHVGKRRDLDDAALHELRGALHVGHIKERVKERAHIRVNLLLKGPREVAQALPRLHHGASKNDTGHLAPLEGAYRHRHGKIGLTCAGGPQTEGNGVGADGVYVALLAERLGPERAPTVGEQDVIAEIRRTRPALAQSIEQAHGLVGGERAPGGGLLHELAKEPGQKLDLTGRAGERDRIAAKQNARRCSLLDGAQNGIARAREHPGINGIGN